MKGNEINSALLAKLQETSTFNTSVNNRVYVDEAPFGITTPYCVITTPSDIPHQDTGSEFEDLIVQFDIVAEEARGVVSGRIRSELEDLLVGMKGSLVVDDRHLTSFKKGTRGSSDNGDFFHKFVQYKISTQIT